MKKIKKIMASLICSIGALSVGQVIAAENYGSVDGVMKITAKVPQLCDIKSGTTLTYDMGEYIGVEKNVEQYLKLNCKANTSIKISVDLGSNSQSTTEQRRLPLDGEQGDVENYLLYSIHPGSPNSSAIGGDSQTYTHKMAYDFYDLPIYVKMHAKQPAAVVGTYSDSLTITMDYQ